MCYRPTVSQISVTTIYLRSFVTRFCTEARRCTNTEPFSKLSCTVSISVSNMIEQLVLFALSELHCLVALLYQNLGMSCSYLAPRKPYVDWLRRKLTTVTTDALMLAQIAKYTLYDIMYEKIYENIHFRDQSSVNFILYEREAYKMSCIDHKTLTEIAQANKFGAF